MSHAARLLIAIGIAAGCSDSRAEAPAPRVAPTLAPTLAIAPRLAVLPVAKGGLCSTKGSLVADGANLRVDEPTFRAVAQGSSGEAASMRFVYRGPTYDSKRLGSGQLRRQIGLKLRAENGCNLVYVMWRLDPKPGIEVSVKRNVGRRNHKECGTRGYTKIRAQRSTPVPELAPLTTHSMRAEIVGDELVAWIDDKAVWRGNLGATARGLRGAAGLRTDNAELDLEDFSAPSGTASLSKPSCNKAELDG